LGFEEMMAFYEKASPEQTQVLEQLLDANQTDDAWGYLQKITETNLEPL